VLEETEETMPRLWPLLQCCFALLFLCCSQAPLAAAVLPSSRPGTVHTLILTDCAKYQDWQTVAAAYAWRDSGQAGAVTRVANCNAEDTKKYDKKMLDYVNTHMAPQVTCYGWLLATMDNHCCSSSLCCLSKRWQMHARTAADLHPCYVG
jgi:hypothetical protein